MEMLNLFSIEMRKWRRTPFLWVTVATSVSAPFLVMLMAGGSSRYLRDWDSFMRQVLLFYVVLIGSLVATLLGAQTIASEYQYDTWKLALTAPIPRWKIYLVKVVHGVLWLVGLSMVACVGGFGFAYLRGVGGQLDVARWFMVFAASGAGLGLLVPVYQVVTLAAKSFFVTSGVGIVATVVALIVVQSKYAGLYPITSIFSLVWWFVDGTLPKELLGSPAVWAMVPAAVAAVSLAAGIVYFRRGEIR